MPCPPAPSRHATRALCGLASALWLAACGPGCRHASDRVDRHEGVTMTSADSSPLSFDQLAEQRAAQAFEVEVRGPQQPLALIEQSCAYVEVIAGEHGSRGWVSFSTLLQTETPLILAIDGRPLEISPRRLRTYLAPLAEQSLAAGQTPDPALVELGLKVRDETQHVGVYGLVIGQRYHARVNVDRYQLPPEGDDDQPQQRKRAVLWISDQPFAGKKPTVPLTPGYEGWTY